MTPNGGYFWYRHLAPLLGVQTRHLSTDQFLKLSELIKMLSEQNFSIRQSGNWTFIPGGDMYRWQFTLLNIFDFIGKIFKISRFRGGIVIRADKQD
jgi:phage pi2 protein 07